MDVTVKCRICGATSEFVSADHVLADASIASFSVVEGSLMVVYDGESEVYWDTQEPADPDKPYECKGCQTKYSMDDMTAMSMPSDMLIAEDD